MTFPVALSEKTAATGYLSNQDICLLPDTFIFTVLCTFNLFSAF